MISRRHVSAIVPAAFALSFIITSASLLASNIQAFAKIDNKSKIMLDGSSFANGAHKIIQSSKNMTMMKMMERGVVRNGLVPIRNTYMFNSLRYSG